MKVKIMDLFLKEIDQLIHSGETPLEMAEKAIALCTTTLLNLHNIVEKEDFKSMEEEINYFRNIKPIPMSYLIYFSKVSNCEVSIPKVGVEHKVRFLKKEIKKINKFFNRQNCFVYYMEQNHHNLDHEFFTRNHRGKFYLGPLLTCFQDPKFSASHDMLWAMIQAMFRYIQYIRERLQQLQPGTQELQPENPPIQLVWTASKASLVEIIYALHGMGVFNHGTAELRTIVVAFERIFHKKLPNVYKSYSEMKLRKGAFAKFILMMASCLEAKRAREDEM